MKKINRFKTSRYGWQRDLPDHRDFLFAAPLATLGPLPAKMDLRPQCPPVYDQGQLGSCTANAIAAAIQFDRLKQNISDFAPSRLFIYYNERVMEHSVASDSGAQIRDGIKSVGQQGDCPETEWPYVVAKFKTKPALACYKDALKYKVVSYQRVTQTLGQLKGCLAAGFPFVFGFTVYESFESAAVAKIGRAALQRSWAWVMTSRNRFSSCAIRGAAGWGLKGYFTLAYAYLSDPNLASDFWTVRVVQ